METNYGVILAAGAGGRIRDVTERPKCLLEVGGRTLLARQLESLAAAGVRRAAVVLGYRQGEIIDHVLDLDLPFDVDFVSNDDPERQGNAFSLFLGVQSQRGSPVVFDGDLIYEQAILDRFLVAARAARDAILVGPGSLDDVECAKTLVTPEGDRVVKTVDKRRLTERELTDAVFLGEALGIMRFSWQGRRKLLELCSRFFAREENLPVNWEALLTVFFGIYPVTPRFEDSTRWCEIDTAEDLARARRIFEGGRSMLADAVTWLPRGTPARSAAGRAPSSVRVER